MNAAQSKPHVGDGRVGRTIQYLLIIGLLGWMTFGYWDQLLVIEGLLQSLSLSLVSAWNDNPNVKIASFTSILEVGFTLNLAVGAVSLASDRAIILVRISSWRALAQAKAESTGAGRRGHADVVVGLLGTCANVLVMAMAKVGYIVCSVGLATSVLLLLVSGFCPDYELSTRAMFGLIGGGSFGLVVIIFCTLILASVLVAFIGVTGWVMGQWSKQIYHMRRAIVSYTRSSRQGENREHSNEHENRDRDDSTKPPDGGG